MRFAARRAELTQAAADAHPGKMAALLGATPEQAEDACTAAPDGCWVANDNAPGQVVIAGTPDGLAAGSARAKEIGVKRVTALNVGGAFHTPLMADATAGLVVEVVGLDAGQAHGVGRVQPRRRRLRRRRRVARTPPFPRVGAGALALDHGHPRRPRRDASFWEVGHGSMLAALAKRGAPNVTVRNIATPEDLTLEVA